MDYVKKNDEILKKMQALSNVDNEHFAEDGIMFRREHKLDENGIWSFSPSEGNKNENELWATTGLRILYILKEQPSIQYGGWDVRCESYHKPWGAISDYNPRLLTFHKNIMSTLYGLFNTTYKFYPSFEKIESVHYRDALELSDKKPYARINCKKEIGESYSKDTYINNYINDINYAPLLAKQILNLDADIILCCTYSESSDNIGKVVNIEDQNSGNYILEFLKKRVYKNLKVTSSNGIWFDETTNRIAINTYHPSYRSISTKDYYDDVIGNYFEFLKKHRPMRKSPWQSVPMPNQISVCTGISKKVNP